MAVVTFGHGTRTSSELWLFALTTACACRTWARSESMVVALVRLHPHTFSFCFVSSCGMKIDRWLNAKKRRVATDG